MKKILNLGAKGSVLLPLIIILPALAVILSSVLGLTVNSIKLAKVDELRTHAQLAADAGLDTSLRAFNIDDTWTGTAGEVTLRNEDNILTTYETILSDGIDDKHKTITATGRSYRPADDTSSPDSEVTIKLAIRAVTSGNYSVVGGVGGLEISNSAGILGGSVHVNGKITMSNTAQIGLSSTPVASADTIDVGHYSCPSPADATYPRLCADGENGEPITLSNSATIYGNVNANTQNDPTAGLLNPGLQSTSGVPFIGLPNIHDRTAQIDAHNLAYNGDPGASPPIAANPNLRKTGAQMSCNSNSATITWPANLKITGNVTISKKCKILLEGDVWITGTLSMSNSATMNPINAITPASPPDVEAADLPVLMVDGAGEAVSMSNSSSISGNTSDVGVLVIAYGSTAGCTPDCADVTGSNLYNSSNVTSISMSNSASAPSTILYGRWSKISISNSGEIGALIAQRISLNNSASITFGASSGVGGATNWVIDTYRRSY